MEATEFYEGQKLRFKKPLRSYTGTFYEGTVCFVSGFYSGIQIFCQGNKPLSACGINVTPEELRNHINGD